ncbi:MAG: hypothetical protein ACE5R4_02420 [Armatimonadota bacterium]
MRPTPRPLAARGRGGLSLLELIFAMVVIVVAAALAIPLARSLFTARVAAETVAQQIVRDMKRARALAVINAATNPEGYEIRFRGPQDDYDEYVMVQLGDSSLVPPARALGAGASGSTEVQCGSAIGASSFVFRPVGNVEVENASGGAVSGDPVLSVEQGPVRFDITLARATGHAEAVAVEP